MEQAKLPTILDEHEKWLTSCGQEGSKANLRGANLRYADLRGANLRGANLYDADLYGANLYDADLYGADLRGADLRYADLRGADLDFSCFPLWRGGLNVHIDDKQATQLLYHLIRNVKFSKNTSKALKQIFQTESLITQANKFHRVNECGTIEEGDTENDEIIKI